MTGMDAHSPSSVVRRVGRCGVGRRRGRSSSGLSVVGRTGAGTGHEPARRGPVHGSRPRRCAGPTGRPGAPGAHGTPHRTRRKGPRTGGTGLSPSVGGPEKTPRGATSVNGHTPGGRAAIGDGTQMVRRPTPIGRPGRRAAGRSKEEAPRPTRGSRPRRVLPPRAREDGARRGMTGDFPGSRPRHCTTRVIVRGRAGAARSGKPTGSPGPGRRRAAFSRPRPAHG